MVKLTLPVAWNGEISKKVIGFKVTENIDLTNQKL